MTYLDLLNGFHDLLMRSQVSKNGQLLYHTLLMINNKSSWSDWFQRTNVSLYSMMGMSEKGLIEARKELKDLGIIDYIPSKKKGQITKYSLLHCKIYGSKFRENDSQNDRENDSQNAVETTAKTTDNIRLKNKTKIKTKTKKEYIKDIPEKSAAFSTGDLRLDEAFAAFVVYRDEIKKPMTDRAKEIAFNKLMDISDTTDGRIAVIEQSIMNGWTGLYPVKNQEQKKYQGKQEPAEFYNDMEEWLHERQGICDDSISD